MSTARPPTLDGVQPKKKRVRFSAEVMFIVSVIFSVALSVIYLSRYSNVRNLLQKEEELTRRIHDVERENRRLKENLDVLSTPEGIERLARERLGLVKPEEVVVFPIPVSAPDPQVASHQTMGTRD